MKHGVKISSPLKVELYSIVWIGHIVFIHLSADGHLSWSHLLAFVTMSVQIPVCASVSNFLGYILRNAIAGSYARSALHFLRIFCTIGCFILFFHQQCPRAVISPYLQQLLLFCVSDSHLSDVCEVISS